MNWKYISSRIVAIGLAACTFVAIQPDSISNQIPQLFPQKWRGFIAMGLVLCVEIAREYGNANRTPASLPTSSTTIAPQTGAVQTTITK